MHLDGFQGVSPPSLIKSVTGVQKRSALNLTVTFGDVAILATLILLTPDLRRSFHLSVSCFTTPFSTL